MFAIINNQSMVKVKYDNIC